MAARPRWPVLRDECGTMQCGPTPFRVESPGQPRQRPRIGDPATGRGINEGQTREPRRFDNQIHEKTRRRGSLIEVRARDGPEPSMNSLRKPTKNAKEAEPGARTSKNGAEQLSLRNEINLFFRKGQKKPLSLSSSKKKGEGHFCNGTRARRCRRPKIECYPRLCSWLCVTPISRNLPPPCAVWSWRSRREAEAAKWVT